MKLRQIFILIAVLVISTGLIAAEEEILLQLNLQPGDTYKMVISTDQDIDQTVFGNQVNTKHQMEMIMFSEVLDANEDTYTLKTTYGDTKFKTASQRFSMEFDTANPDPNLAEKNPQAAMIANVYTAMKGSELLMEINRQGKTIKITGFDELFEKMMPDDTQAAAMKQMMKQFMNEDVFKDMSNNSFTTFPDYPVAVGDIWDTIVAVGTDQFPIDLDATCTVKKIEDGIVTIETASKIDMGATGGKVFEMNGNKANLLLTGLISGTGKVDQQTGWLIESTQQQNMTGTVTIEPTEQMPQGMKIPMTIKQTTTVTSQKL